jgi:preprotein translocase subunit SecG
MSILLDIATVVLLMTSVILIFLVLAQKAKSDGGMGAAMGGGMAEATFGADTGNVLSKATINASIVFFILSFALYLGHIYEGKHAASSGGALPSISVPLSAAPSKAPAGVALPPAATPAPAAKP